MKRSPLTASLNAVPPMSLEAVRIHHAAVRRIVQRSLSLSTITKSKDMMPVNARCTVRRLKEMANI